MTNLQILSINENNVSDISALSNLTKLENLSINRNQIMDINVLSKLSSLSTIYAEEQAAFRATNKKQVSLPSIFIEAQNKDSIFYSEEELQLENCTLSKDKKSITITDTTKQASVSIIDGKLKKSKLILVYMEGAVNDSSKGNSINNSNNKSATNSGKSTKETKKASSKSTTKSTSKNKSSKPTKLPYTGISTVTILLIILISIISVILWKKNSKYKNI